MERKAWAQEKHFALIMILSVTHTRGLIHWSTEKKEFRFALRMRFLKGKIGEVQNIALLSEQKRAGIIFVFGIEESFLKDFFFFAHQEK